MVQGGIETNVMIGHEVGRIDHAANRTATSGSVGLLGLHTTHSTNNGGHGIALQLVSRAGKAAR